MEFRNTRPAHKGASILFSFFIALLGLGLVACGGKKDDDADKFNLNFTASLAATGIDFTAATSTAPAGSTIVNYSWDFGDASGVVASSTPEMNHVYAAFGTYQVTLTVTSDKAESSNLTKQVVYADPASTLVLDPSINPIGNKWNVLPITMHISTSVSSEKAAALESMSQKWEEAALGLNFYDIKNDSVANVDKSVIFDYLDDSTHGIYLDSTWVNDLGTNTLGVCVYSGFIRNAGTSNEYIDIKNMDLVFNTRDHNFSADQMDFASVALHELGHGIGLQHDSTRTTSIMYPSISSNVLKRSLDATDIKTVQSRYYNEILGQSGVIILHQNAGGNSTIQQNDDEEEGIPVRGYIAHNVDGSETKVLEIVKK